MRSIRGAGVARGTTSTERIVAAATVLFAERGFNGVSTREISSEAGLNISTVNYHVGSKRDLYREVMRRFYGREEEMVEGLVKQVDEKVLYSRSLLRGRVGSFARELVRFIDEEPARSRLYVGQWLEGGGGLAEAEASHGRRMRGRFKELIHRAQEAGTVRRSLDADAFLQSTAWMIHGQFIARPIRPQDRSASPGPAEELQNFESFLCDYLARMLGLEDEEDA